MSGSNIKSSQGRTGLPNTKPPMVPENGGEKQKAKGGSKVISPQTDTAIGPVSTSL
jgi:hypothetical protein